MDWSAKGALPRATSGDAMLVPSLPRLLSGHVCHPSQAETSEFFILPGLSPSVILSILGSGPCFLGTPPVAPGEARTRGAPPTQVIKNLRILRLVKFLQFEPTKNTKGWENMKMMDMWRTIFTTLFRYRFISTRS